MAFNGSGVFTRIYNWVTEQASSPIEIAKLDTQEEDFATALSNCILRDGTGIPTADTPWNSKKITGLADPTSAQDAATKAYVDTNGSFTGTWTGMSGSVTGTIYYAKAGKVVTMMLPGVVGTSNATGFTITGVPVAIRPAQVQHFVVPDGRLMDNSAALLVSGGNAGNGYIDTSTLTFLKNNSSSGWTNSGSKGTNGAFSFSYLLN